jgi:CRISPR/Cas system-associated endonuclease Cas3-HD
VWAKNMKPTLSLDNLKYSPLLAAPNEPLEKHITDSINEFINRFSPKKEYTLIKLLRSYDVNIDLIDAKRVFLYSIIFHDIGKAYDWFQNRIIEAINEQKRDFSVPRHELFSAYATLHLLNENAFTNAFQFLRNCILLTIIWSHSSSRGMVLKRIAETIPRYVNVEYVKLSEERILELMSMIESILTKYKCRDGIDLLKLPAKISINEVKEMLNTLHDMLYSKSIGSNYSLYYATIPVLSTLQLIDSLVAYKNRGGCPQIYITDLPNHLIISKVREKLWLIE